MDVKWTSVRNAEESPESNISCSKCGHKTLFHPNYVKAGIALCTRKKCKKIEEVAALMLQLRGYKYLSSNKRGDRVNIKFICGSEHTCDVLFETLRRGAGCKQCHINGSKKERFIEQAQDRISCNCRELKLGKMFGSTRVCGHYNFKVIFPECAEEWDVKRNTFSATEIAPKSDTKC